MKAENIIAGFMAAVDLIYNPYETKLLHYAKKHGAKCTNGLYMLVSQAVAAQEIWNGIKIEDKVIDKIFKDVKEVWLNGGR